MVRRWQSGNSQRQIATGTVLSRATVRRYIVAAMGAGLTRDGAAPSEDQLSRLAGLNLCTPRKVETPHKVGWTVRGASSKKPSSIHRTQAAATKRARELARRQGTEVIVHRPTGRIRNPSPRTCLRAASARPRGSAPLPA